MLVMLMVPGIVPSILGFLLISAADSWEIYRAKYFALIPLIAWLVFLVLGLIVGKLMNRFKNG